MKYAIAILIAVIVSMVVFWPTPKIVDNTDYLRIERLKDSIQTLNSQDTNLRFASDSLIVIKDTLFVTLREVQEIHDTIRIIEVQDSIINVQHEEIITLNTRLDIKDLIIQQNDSLTVQIVSDKDLYIEDLQKALKKEKRKRIITTIIAGAVIVAGGIAAI